MKELYHIVGGSSSYRRIQKSQRLACSTHSCLFWLEDIHTNGKTAGTNKTVWVGGQGEPQSGNSLGSDAARLPQL